MSVQPGATEHGGGEHPEGTRGAAPPSVRGPVGVSALSAGERHGSWRRSEDKVFVCTCTCVCDLTAKVSDLVFCVVAYTNDVVHAIQRSKMLICLLSDDYLSNNDAVFVLESGVQVGLHKCRVSSDCYFSTRVVV